MNTSELYNNKDTLSNLKMVSSPLLILGEGRERLKDRQAERWTERRTDRQRWA